MFREKMQQKHEMCGLSLLRATSRTALNPVTKGTEHWAELPAPPCCGKAALCYTPHRCKLQVDMLASPTVSEQRPAALTVLTEEERLFQSTIRRFTREQIAPHVREMD